MIQFNPLIKRYLCTYKEAQKPVRNTMLIKNSLNGKVALVTGGGTGLGKGIAMKLSELGASVAIMSRKLNILEATAKEISEKTGNKVIPLEADVREPTSISMALDTMEKKTGIPNIIINNAAGNFVSPFERLNAKGFKTITDIVLNGTANVTLESGKRLIESKKGGVFLNITTTYAETGSGYVVPSAASKAGVSALTKSLAVEWSKYGIRFVGIAPGPVETKGAWARLDPTGIFKEKMLSNNPTGRFGTVEEIANLATYLVSDYASWMNGEIVTLDGGETRYNSGEFNFFHKVSDEEWSNMEKKIRDINKK